MLTSCETLVHKLPAAPSVAMVVHHSSWPRAVFPHIMGPEPLRGPTLLHIKSQNKLSLNLKWQEILIACPDSVLEWFKMSWRKELLPFTHQSGGEKGNSRKIRGCRMSYDLPLILEIFTAIRWLTRCDNFIPTSSSAERPACCASVTKQQIQGVFYFAWDAGPLKGDPSDSDLWPFQCGRLSDCSIDAGLGGWEWVGSLWFSAWWNCRLNCGIGCELIELNLHWKWLVFFLLGRSLVRWYFVCMYIYKFYCEHVNGFQ